MIFLTHLTRIIFAARPDHTVKAFALLLALLPLQSTTYADTNTQQLTGDIIRPDCVTELHSEQATIERITDGDTVVLTDQRRVRLIGINTAELNAPNPKLKAAAQQATDKLKDWLPHAEPVTLYIGDEPYDRHGRVLAHVIRASDGLAVAHMMVQSGLAVQSAVAPTTRCAVHFLALENQAVEARLGLWKIRDLISTRADKLNTGKRGFKLIAGRVTSVKSRKRYVELIIGKQFQVRVRTELAKQMSLQPLLGQEIEVRGWLSHKKNNTFLWLQHAANLLVLGN